MSTLDSLLKRPDIWRSRDQYPSAHGLSTGHGALDRVLGGGWPAGALIELSVPLPGVGEWRLLSPRLADICRRGQWQLWVDPPLLPFAPALLQRGLTLERVLIVHTDTTAQWLWVCDQALRSPGCAAVVCWAAQRPRYAELRRLQVAARERGGMAFLLGSGRSAEAASPAALRLRLACSADGEGGLAIEVLKQRGRAAGQHLVLAAPAGLQPQPPLRERPSITSTVTRAATRMVIGTVAGTSSGPSQAPDVAYTPSADPAVRVAWQ